MEFVLLSARVVHVLLGVFWAGATLFLVLYLEPAVREAGPEGGKVMAGVVRRGFPRTLSVAGLLTLVTGVYLLWSMSGGFASGFMGSRSGIFISTGMLAGILALGVGVHVSKPTAERMQLLREHMGAAAGSPSAEDQAEMKRLQGKLRSAWRIGAVLLVVAVVTMSLGPHI